MRAVDTLARGEPREGVPGVLGKARQRGEAVVVARAVAARIDEQGRVAGPCSGRASGSISAALPPQPCITTTAERGRGRHLRFRAEAAAVAASASAPAARPGPGMNHACSDLPFSVPMRSVSNASPCAPGSV